MHDHIEKILYSEDNLKNRVQELGAQITRDYAGEEVFVIGILKGSNIFMSDLVRQINLPIQIDFMVVSSYGNATESTGVVRILKDLEFSIEEKNVIIVEDIIDSGLTLAYLKENLLRREPKSLKICTLLDKPARRSKNIDVDYVGYEVPDEFIVGYGIDYAERYRNLPYVGALKRSIYENA